MESLMDLLEEARKKEGFSRVRSLRVTVGAFSCVDPGALRFCFDVVTRGSVAEGAVLDIEPVPGTGWCFGCNREIRLDGPGEGCSLCGSVRIQRTAGDDLRLEDIIVE